MGGVKGSLIANLSPLFELTRVTSIGKHPIHALRGSPLGAVSSTRDLSRQEHAAYRKPKGYGRREARTNAVQDSQVIRFILKGTCSGTSWPIDSEAR